MKDKTTCTVKFGYWDYFIPAKCNWNDKKMPLGFKLDPKTFRIVEVNSFGRYDGFKVGMRVTGLHFYYYKLAGSYKVVDDKRWQQFQTRLNQLKACRYLAVSVESSKNELMYVHSSLNNFVHTMQRGGKNGKRSQVTHSKRDATRLNALWVLDTKLLCPVDPTSEKATDSSSLVEIQCVTDVFPGLGMKRDMHMTRMKRSLNKVKHYQARIFALQDELHKINEELERWINTRKEKRDEMEYKMNKDREILHCDPLEAARFSYADADILVSQLTSQLEDLTIDKEDKVIAKVDLRYAKRVWNEQKKMLLRELQSWKALTRSSDKCVKSLMSTAKQTERNLKYAEMRFLRCSDRWAKMSSERGKDVNRSDTVRTYFISDRTCERTRYASFR